MAACVSSVTDLKKCMGPMFESEVNKPSALRPKMAVYCGKCGTVLESTLVELCVNEECRFDFVAANKAEDASFAAIRLEREKESRAKMTEMPDSLPLTRSKAVLDTLDEKSE